MYLFHLIIEAILQYLQEVKFINKFVIWGRSMGAVATLLFAKQLSEQQSETIELDHNQSHIHHMYKSI